MKPSAACNLVRTARPMWSVGYVVRVSRPPTAEEKARGAKRVIVKWEVLEVSPVDNPGGTGTGTMEAICTAGAA